MKPAAFEYMAVESVDAALHALADNAGDIRVLAGGQSLGPLLNLRIAVPGVLVDINRLDELSHIDVTPDGSLSIGALTRQRRVETSARVATSWRMLTEAISHIGHRAIRNRGTIGGSIAHADPAAELPAVLIALDATIQTASVRGIRSIPATEFFLGPFTTALELDELLVGVTIPAVPSRTGQAWLEIARRHGDFGVIGVAAATEFDSEGTCVRARLVYSGADWAPWQPETAASLLIGRAPTPTLFAEVGRVAAGESSPPADIHASADHRRRLIEVLTARALARCAGAAWKEPV